MVLGGGNEGQFPEEGRDIGRDRTRPWQNGLGHSYETGRNPRFREALNRGRGKSKKTGDCEGLGGRVGRLNALEIGRVNIWKGYSSLLVGVRGNNITVVTH